MEDDEQYDIALNSMDTSVPDTHHFVQFSNPQQDSGWWSQFNWLATFGSAEHDYSSLFLLYDEADDDNQSRTSSLATTVLYPDSGIIYQDEYRLNSSSGSPVAEDDHQSSTSLAPTVLYPDTGIIYQDEFALNRSCSRGSVTSTIYSLRLLTSPCYYRTPSSLAFDRPLLPPMFYW